MDKPKSEKGKEILDKASEDYDEQPGEEKPSHTHTDAKQNPKKDT